jgi:hypothetical protein
VGLVAGYLLKGLLIRQEQLPAHVLKVLRYLFSFVLRSQDIPAGFFGGGLKELFSVFADMESDDRVPALTKETVQATSLY